MGSIMRRLLFFLLILLAQPWPAAGIDVPIGDSPVLGAADAAVTMIEFIDFQ